MARDTSKWLGRGALRGIIREQRAPACTQPPSCTTGQGSGAAGACRGAWGAALLWGITPQRGEEGSPTTATPLRRGTAEEAGEGEKTRLAAAGRFSGLVISTGRAGA